jgi:hypothetical protein
MIERRKRSEICLSALCFCLLILNSGSARAQIDIFGFISQDRSSGTPGGSYLLTDLLIGSRKSGRTRFEFSEIVVQCKSSSAFHPKWELTIFTGGGLATHYFYGNEDISPSVISSAIDDLMKDRPELGKPKVKSIDPGTADVVDTFSVRCFPTFDDSTPSMVRLRFFSGPPNIKETFATDWVPLPNIKRLPLILTSQDKGQKFFFAEGQKAP